MAIDKKLIDQLLTDYKKPEDIIGENGLLKELNPNFSFITPNTCSTFERTVDLVRFLARSTSST